MKQKLFIILLIIFIIILFYLLHNIKIIEIYFNDILHVIKINFVYNFNYNNNFLISKKKKNNKILIVSFDNRKNLKYLKLHNNNIINYCKKYNNISYEFLDNNNNKNIYWCKLYLVLKKLESNKYDYVMWMDTDSFIINDNISINKIINSYESDIFISHDTISNNIIIKNIALCSGVFIIKNSLIGKNFIKECIDYYENSKCNNNNKLHGFYAQKCYEQGVMNYYIFEKYLKYTTILSIDIINNTYDCNKKTFILHKFGSSEEDIINCMK
jgi:hypothetical protein